jgi:hydrogenase maturation protein HypF
MFDAVAALVGLRRTISYEGQAARELEAASDPAEKEAYEFPIGETEIPTGPVIRRICEDRDRGIAAGRIAARFHNGLVDLIVKVCARLREIENVKTVALSGGVMQNRTLVSRTVPALEGKGYRVLRHRLVPPGDGGICLGQAACARAVDKESGEHSFSPQIS